MYCMETIKTFHSYAELQNKYKEYFRLQKSYGNKKYEYLNDYIIRPNTDNLTQLMKKRLADVGYGNNPHDKHIRKNAVIGFTVRMDYSPDAIVDVEKFKTDCLKWLKNHFEKYNGNIIAFVCHGDEPNNFDETGNSLNNYHLHAIIQPITQHGKLSAKQLLGNITDYRNLQKSFGEEVGAAQNLSTGTVIPNITHKMLTHFNSKLNEDVPDSKKDESVNDYAKRIEDFNLKRSIQVIKLRQNLVKQNYQLKAKIKNNDKYIVELKQKIEKLNVTDSEIYEAEQIDCLDAALLEYNNKELSDKIQMFERWGEEFYHAK